MNFKTITDFRRVFWEFVQLCRRPDLYGREFLAEDAARIKAVNNRDRNSTEVGPGAPHEPNLAEKIAGLRWRRANGSWKQAVRTRSS